MPNSCSGSARLAQHGHSRPWCMQEPGMSYMADTFQYWQSTLITVQALSFLSVMACHSLERT